MLAFGSGFTVDWLLAVERGEVALTERMVQNLQALFNNCPPTPLPSANSNEQIRLRRSRVNLKSELVELNQFPHGDFASRLRAELQLPATLGRPATLPESQAPESIGASVTNSARFLVFLPALVLFAVVLLAARTLELNLQATVPEGKSSSWLNWVSGLNKAVVWPLTVTGVLAAALSVHVGNSFFRSAAARGRARARRRMLISTRNALAAQGVGWDPSEGLELTTVSTFLLPQHRQAAIESGLRAAASERIEFSVAVGLIVAFIGAVIAAFTNGRTSQDLWPATVLLGTGVLLWLVHHDANAES